LAAEESYQSLNVQAPASEEFVQTKRYTAVSRIVTYALITSMSKSKIEIADLPAVLRQSRWSFYLDNMAEHGSEGCIEKWVGHLDETEVAIVNVRPDGYVGSAHTWNAAEEGSAAAAYGWLDEYFGRFLSA